MIIPCRSLPLFQFALLASTCFLPISVQAQNQVAALDVIEIIGRAESGTYHADSTTGTKTELLLRELPQSVRVITRQAIDDLGATKLDDVLDYVGGISRQNNFGGMWDNVVIRGLPGDQNGGMASLFNGFASITAKLVAWWRLNSTLRMTVDVDNLFDRTYYSNSYWSLWTAPGAGRSATLGLQANF